MLYGISFNLKIDKLFIKTIDALEYGFNKIIKIYFCQINQDQDG